MDRLKHLLFCMSGIIFSFMFFLLVNPALTLLDNNSSLPKDINERAYLIKDLKQNHDNNLISFTIEDIPDNAAVALTINDMGSYIPELSLKVNGTEVYSYDETEQFFRTHIIEIDSRLIEENQLIIEIDTKDWLQRSSEIISQKRNAPIKIILSSPALALKIQIVWFSIMCALIGVAFMIVVSCIPISLNRPQETSFLFLILLACVRIFCMTIDVSLIHLSMKSYYFLHHAIVVLPAILNTAVGLWLLCDHNKKINTRFAFFTTCFSLIALFLQYSFKYNWYHLFQFFGFLLFFFISLSAAKQKKRGWSILTVGYMINYGLVCMVYLTNIWNQFPYGCTMICMNITNFSYMFSMISCMFFICLRLSDKYNESERLTAQLLEINSQLDKKVEERTHELNLAHKQQQNLMMNVFHDLRNPVFILKDCAQKLPDEDENQQKIKKTMIQRLNFLQHLINDLFLSEKLECGKISILKDCVELKELLKDIIEEMEDSYKRKIDYSLDEAMIWADEARLTQVFQNLIQNAILHSNNEAPITVTSSSSNRKASVSIKNSGSCMSEKEIDHAFERYYSSSTNGGTGLGLYIAKELIELHEGTIYIRSDGISTTEFVVELNCMNEKGD